MYRLKGSQSIILMLFLSNFIFTTNAQISKFDLWDNEPFSKYDEKDEIVSLRDENAKHFKNSDGTTTAFITAGRMHYHENGVWKTIFHSIVPSQTGFTNTTNSFKTYYPKLSNGSIKTTLASGESFYDMISMKMYYQDGSTKINTQNIQAKNGNVAFNELSYDDVYGPNINLKLTQHNTFRKLDYIVESKTALDPNMSQYDFLVFEEQVQLPNGWIASLENSQILVFDQNGTLALRFEKPVLKDTPIHTHEEEMNASLDHSNCEHQHATNESLAIYELQQQGNILTIKTKVPISWINSTKRAFPIIIDPTVTCTPDVTARWTGYHRTTSGSSGYSDGSPNFTSTNITANSNDAMKLGRTNTDEVYNNWIKFNIASVPDNACINSADINYGISYNYSNDPPNCQINVRMRHMSTDPSVAFNAGNNATRLADIRDGNIYQQQNLAAGPIGSGWRSVVMGGFLADITSQLAADWFAVGLNSYSGGPHTSCYIDLYGQSSASRPYLEVTYRTPTVNAGSDQNICLGQQISLNGSVTPTAPVTTTLLSENFESYGNVTPLPTSGATWRSTELSASTTWTWQIKNSCTPAGGARCLNMNDSYGTDCDYTWDDGGMKVAWYGTAIDASMHSALKLNFKWKAAGEAGFDWGHVVYSLDGSNWMDLTTTQYQGQSSWQTVSNLDISKLDGQIFYIGFKWLNDDATGAAPGFSIDDVSITATPMSYTYSWAGGPIVSGSNTLTPVVNPSANSTYTLTVGLGACSFTDQMNVTLPTMNTTLSNNNESASCLVSGNNWIHFYHNSGRYIGAIHPQNQNLGMVTMTSYVDVTNALVPACAQPLNPSLMTSVMQRHWVMTPTSQPLAAVQVGLPFTNVELSSLVTASNANANSTDDVAAIGGVLLSKYHGPANVDNNAPNNCPANGGNGGTTIHAQTSNGDLSLVFPGFVNTSYTTHSIPNFSEFWLHGASNSSPLPVELSTFSADCNENGTNLLWKTASESNSAYFEVNRSENGYDWQNIATIEAAGNSNEEKTYQYFDDDARANKIYYYALNQFDINGVSKAYEPISTNCISEMEIQVYPNPFDEQLTVILAGNNSENDIYLYIEDISGKVILQKTIIGDKNTMIKLDVQHLSSGVYFLRICDANGQIKMKKIVKN